MEEVGLFYEGCGAEGPVRAIFISEFHHILGPRITLQYPEDTISKEIYDALSPYIIPKTHLQKLIMTVNALEKKIIGYPIQIRNDKYERNAFYFNVCFVCDSWARTVQYEQVLIKFAEFLHSLELEIEFLSKITNSEELLGIFREILNGLNSSQKECSIIVRESLLKLKVVHSVIDNAPPLIRNHQVPVFITDVNPIDNWDLTTQQVIPFVDGFNHISKLANLADVDADLVKNCLQNLLYYRVIKLIPLFQYSNTYCNVPIIHSKLINGDGGFKEECLYFVSRNEHTRPHFSDVIRFYLSMKRGLTIKDLCCRFKITKALPTTRLGLPEARHSSPKLSDYSLSSSTQSRTSSNPTTPIKIFNAGGGQYQSSSYEKTPAPATKDPTNAYTTTTPNEFTSILSVIDERRLVLFGVVHGLIRRVEKYPILTTRGASHYLSNSSNHMMANDNLDHLIKLREKYGAIYSMFDGSFNYDEICSSHDLSQTQLDEIIDADPDVVVLWK